MRQFCLLTLVLLSFAVSAEDTPLWKEIGGWQVRVDQTLGYGCFVIGVYDGQSYFRLGFDRANDTGYFIIGNAAWRSIESGKLYPINVEFDGEPPWEVTATGVDFGGLTGLWGNFDNADFINEFSERHALKLYYQGREIDRLSLKGSYQAIQEMIECQVAVEETVKPDPHASQPDPFSQDAPGSDPFM